MFGLFLIWVALPVTWKRSDRHVVEVDWKEEAHLLRWVWLRKEGFNGLHRGG